MTNKLVLYIEDRPDNRSLVRRVLMAEDFEVLELPTPKMVFNWPLNTNLT